MNVEQLRKHRRKVLAMVFVAFGVIALLTVLCWQLITPTSSAILDSSKDLSDKKISTGLVLGAGVAPNGKPYDELKARLNVAADALQTGRVKKLILSGDNRFRHYDEPTAMRKYLITERKVDASRLVLDYAGRSTYESCERAAKTFNQRRLVIFSAKSHLPRAIYLCRHFGIESYGVSSELEANNGWYREIFARVKAVCNVYLTGEKTVL